MFWRRCRPTMDAQKTSNKEPTVSSSSVRLFMGDTVSGSKKPNCCGKGPSINMVAESTQVCKIVPPKALSVNSCTVPRCVLTIVCPLWNATLNG